MFEAEDTILRRSVSGAARRGATLRVAVARGLYYACVIVSRF